MNMRSLAATFTWLMLMTGSAFAISYGFHPIEPPHETGKVVIAVMMGCLAGFLLDLLTQYVYDPQERSGGAKRIHKHVGLVTLFATIITFGVEMALVLGSLDLPPVILKVSAVAVGLLVLPLIVFLGEYIFPEWGEPSV